MKFRGLTIRVNPLFLLILIFFFLLEMIGEVLIAFSLVIAHEFIHMIVAYYAGYKVSKIEIFPFGGMAEYNGLLEMEPWQEIKVSLSGPLFNLLFALFIYLFIYTGLLKPGTYINLLFYYNLIIASVNLIPALPLDGGRILRALLVRNTGLKRGNDLALKVSKFFAIIGIITGIFILLSGKTNLWFLFFFFFIYGMINREKKQLFYYFLQYLSRRRDINNQLRIKELAGQVVSDTLPVKEVIYYINPVKYSLFFVLDIEQNIKGIITESHLVRSYFNQKDKELILRDII